MSFLWIFVKIYLILGFIVSIVYQVNFFTSSEFLMVFVMLITTFSVIVKFNTQKKRILSLGVGYLVVHYLLSSSITMESLIYVFLGILFGVGTSIIASLYPAYKAANLDPIKALKSD